VSESREKFVPLGPRFREAMDYASRLHEHQSRKATSRPYLGHLLGVTALVLRYGGDEDMAIAALLHDAVEDQGGLPTLASIREKFGARVAGIVEACTDSHETPKPPWLERKRRYVEHAASAPLDVCIVSAADKLYNVREIIFDYRMNGEALWPRFSGGRDGVLWYYRALVNAFRRAGLGELCAELDRAVTEMELLVSQGSPARSPA
jgi:(p)ppGpp synthase/HD superfamily hydrolase